MSSGALILPLTAAFGYACGAIAIKRALGAGISGTWVNFFCNSLMALLFQIFWFFPGNLIGTAGLGAPILCGALFFIGQIFTFRAISRGDVSIATPLLGTKVILVALFSLFLLHHAPPASWLVAALLASIGIALISYSPGGSHERLGATIGWSLGAAALFALTDVLVQHWVHRVGYYRFAPVMFGTAGFLSLFYLPALLRGRWSGRSHLAVRGYHDGAILWLTAGAVLLSLQSLAIYSAIGIYRSATLTNILYGSRCLWSVLLVWCFGTLAGETPTQTNRSSIMGWRFAGALFLFSSMAIVLR
jgi:drug/metabolite transporter (DMT)-like permease